MASELSCFIRLLQKAYSGELAAALAYRGHWKSTSEEADRARIQQIEEEEWNHREKVRRMLSILGSKPDLIRETRSYLVGRVLGFLCAVAGSFVPMYAAGRLESRNIVEYENAAQFACDSGHPELLECLLTMAEMEWEHEHYFREKVLQYKMPRYLSLWPSPPPKKSIRSRYPTPG
ncbi:ferritin-like domain-containing protein [bacterium]|nr:ferritin-like domain-containing protein [bacterium]MCI0605841.1 ferritin-like domain-containing protein [bacterium]